MTQRILHLDWICTTPTPYNDVLFSAIAADPEFDLTVHFMEAIHSSHPWQSNLGQGFPRRFYRRTLGVDLDMLSHAAAGNRFLVVAGWHEATSQLAILLRYLRGKPFALWTDSPKMGGRSRSKEFLRNRFLRIAFAGASSIMGTGRLALERLASMGCPAEKLINLPCFIDIQQFRPAQNALPTNSLTFVSSGRIVNALKGHDLAVEAIAKVQEANPGLAMRYRIAGTGPDRDDLIARAARLKVDLEICNWVEPDAMPNFYQSGHVLLHPARYEPYATAVLEGMACGLAVIGSSETGAVVDRIEHGQSGLVHQAGSVDSLATLIDRLCRQPTEIQRLGRAARAVAEQWPVDVGVQIVRDVARAAMQEA